MNKKEILIIVPTRGRPQKVRDFYELFKANSVASDIVFGLDTDDYESYYPLDGAMYSINENMRLCPKLNLLANKFVDKYKYIGFTGDDVKINTYGWDARLIEPLKQSIGIAYGNDHYHGDWLPNTFIVNSEVIKTLGWMVPPTLNHFYMDNFYKDLGSQLGILHYFEDVDLEHKHYTKGKSEFDATYQAAGNMEEDRVRYNMYIESSFMEDVEKVRSLIK